MNVEQLLRCFELPDGPALPARCFEHCMDEWSFERCMDEWSFERWGARYRSRTPGHEAALRHALRGEGAR